ncbi:hypothetical protein [Nocardioides panzhihuensis]|uniref:Uncharacterized protein n=1 Tax=Nocardioides panzhihuensis TaxID=860243 RepID=A0A7Z0DI21_9ACTN|nr:hypothetical protein [Nocardioides panzhihuensis]NYI75827.1 hypothetical protein [Nocardioides panzhihuensis]
MKKADSGSNVLGWDHAITRVFGRPVGAWSIDLLLQPPAPFRPEATHRGEAHPVGRDPGARPRSEPSQAALADVLAYRHLLYKQRSEFIAESSAAYEIDEDLVDIDDPVDEARKNR